MRRLRRFGFNRIKEGFDQLPTAICFFDSRGSIVLCNRQMYRLSHYLFESDRYPPYSKAAEFLPGGSQVPAQLHRDTAYHFQINNDSDDTSAKVI